MPAVRRNLGLLFCWAVLALSLVGFVRSMFFAADNVQYATGALLPKRADTLAATPHVISWRRRRRFAKRLASGHCTRCGYNRAGVPADRACPECGAPSPAPTPAAATNT